MTPPNLEGEIVSTKQWHFLLPTACETFIQTLLELQHQLPEEVTFSLGSTSLFNTKRHHISVSDRIPVQTNDIFELETMAHDDLVQVLRTEGLSWVLFVTFAEESEFQIIQQLGQDGGKKLAIKTESKVIPYWLGQLTKVLNELDSVVRCAWAPAFNSMFFHKLSTDDTTNKPCPFLENCSTRAISDKI